MRTALIGIGQAGGKLVQAMAHYDLESGFDAIDGALAVNTARADLRGLEVDTLLIGQDRVDGHGVGGDNELGAAIMQSDVDEVVDVLDGRISTETEAIVLLAGLGGGTGSGGAPVLARRLREIYDRPVYVIGILPGQNEGSLYQLNAGRSLKTLVNETDSLLLIDNDAWRSSEASVHEAFEETNQRIARRVGLLFASGEAVEGVGQSVVDSSEIVNTLRHGGLATIGYATARASEKSQENVTTIGSLVRQALRSNMSVPDATDAQAALVIIAGRPAAIPRKGVERARTWLEDDIGSQQVRGGDFPLDDDGLAAIVLLGGVERSDQITSFMERASAAKEEVDREDPAEAFQMDALDDVF